MCDNFPSLLVASQISRSNHTMVLTGSKEIVFDLTYIGYLLASHTQIYYDTVNLTVPAKLVTIYYQIMTFRHFVYFVKSTRF